MMFLKKPVLLHMDEDYLRKLAKKIQVQVQVQVQVH
jgi:hypothetical protein